MLYRTVHRKHIKANTLSEKFSVDDLLREPLWSVANLNYLAYIGLAKHKRAEDTCLSMAAYSVLEIEESTCMEGEGADLTRCGRPVD